MQYEENRRPGMLFSYGLPHVSYLARMLACLALHVDLRGSRFGELRSLTKPMSRMDDPSASQSRACIVQPKGIVLRQIWVTVFCAVRRSTVWQFVTLHLFCQDADQTRGGIRRRTGSSEAGSYRSCQNCNHKDGNQVSHVTN